jgi:hypothetical protein
MLPLFPLESITRTRTQNKADTASPLLAATYEMWMEIRADRQSEQEEEEEEEEKEIYRGSTHKVPQRYTRTKGTFK